MRPFHEQTLTVRANEFTGATDVLDECGATIAADAGKEAQTALLAHGDMVRTLMSVLAPKTREPERDSSDRMVVRFTPGEWASIKLALRKAGALGGES